MDEPSLRASLERLGRFSFSRSSGPGGQNVNKVNTKVELRFSLLALEGLSEQEKSRIRIKLSSRLVDGDTLIITADSERSQLTNRMEALQKAFILLRNACHQPKPRKKTKPSRSAIERRLQSKKIQGSKKSGRNNSFET